MEQYLPIVSVPVIATIVYWVINLVKYAVKSNEIFLRFISLISATLGVVLGIVCFYAFPEIIPAENILMALLIGGASGLSATGCNQIFKQLGTKNKEKTDGEK